MKEVKKIIKSRFAPSPTGFMHIGNLRTALFSYLFAKNQKGEFLLRIEDTDRERSKPEYIASLLEDFRILGLNWDGEIVYQSQRTAIYERFYEELYSKNLTYRCFCSEEKLNLMRKVQLSQGLPPRYAGTCLNLPKEEVQKKLDNKELACWRFKVPKNIVVEFDDLIKGKQTFNSNDFGDFVIKRQDGASSFMFCSVIDDVLQGVTHVLRGEDHVSNTPRQLLILQAVGLKAPQYGHFSLLINGADGTPKLSKRNGSQSIQDLLQEGYLPQAILNYLARLGHVYTSQENHLLSLEELSLNFNLKHISSNSAKHDIGHLKFWQKQAMLLIKEDELLEILQKDINFLNIFNNNKNKLSAFLSLIKDNIVMPQEALIWAKAFFTDNFAELEISDDIENILKTININFLQIVIDNMENKQDFPELCNKLKKAGFIGKGLFVNLRIIFTGKTFGPELNKIFELVGPERIKTRAVYILRQYLNA
jgi:glutamyl-tRNA synthetase